MKVKQYKIYFIESLLPFYDEMEAESFFYLILEHKHQLRRIDLALDADKEFSEKDISNWNVILEKLKIQIPIQYILGTTHFYGLEFTVDKNVLIPRPETEELVDWIVKLNSKLSKKQNLKILDIGTGSGCIAISLAKNIANSEVFAVDISETALAVAQENAKRNKVNVTFLNKNILETTHLDQKFDIIVSNPPYVRNIEKAEIKPNVLDNEPHLALFVSDNDPLIFYKKIAVLAAANLNPNGQLFFEINQYLGKETQELLETIGLKNIELRKDIYGNDRMIACNF
ncbi:MAG: peptide chain release factor N(5)-glutamine methyltransferase [Flavobacterium sp.]|jgi:release factor glutamine methyltransferase|nr:peptide chain release factor N(5)-glutamine methyltransferase [Flavobacterium sp.]